jgi:hypothetical protein
VHLVAADRGRVDELFAPHDLVVTHVAEPPTRPTIMCDPLRVPEFSYRAVAPVIVKRVQARHRPR